MKRALDFLNNHVEIAFATCEGDRPRIRIFQIMMMQGTTLYFATSPVKDVFRQLHNNPILPRLYTSFYMMAYFKVEIEEMDHYDLEPTPPMFKHFNLNDNTVNDGYVGERYSKK